MSVPLRVAFTSLLFSFTALTAGADPHFSDCAFKTGRSANLIIPASINPAINGQALATGSEVAIFSPQGLCAGRIVWNEKNVAITIWGNDVLSDQKEGMENGEELIFQVWDARSRKLYVGPELVNITLDESKSYYRGEATFAEGAIYRLSEFSIDTRLSPSLLAPHDGIQVEKSSVDLSWSSVSGATRYHLQVADNSSFGDPVVDEEVSGTGHSIETDEGVTYFWRVGVDTPHGKSWSETYSFAVRDPNAPELVDGFILEQNYPNPFNPSTTIPFEMTEGGDVSLSIFNMLGQKVATLVDGFMAAGRHEVQWSATDLPSGIYIYRLGSARTMLTRTLTLVK